jgi:hypothetical protein
MKRARRFPAATALFSGWKGFCRHQNRKEKAQVSGVKADSLVEILRGKAWSPKKLNKLQPL